MRLSLLICSRNRADHLRATLRSVAGLTIPSGASVEVVLVDNGSTDATATVMREFQAPGFSVRTVSQPERGAANARNAGIQAANGEILLFTDDDVRLPANWISAMIAPIRTGQADVVQGRIDLAAHLERPWMNEDRRAQRLARVDQFDVNRPTLTSANFALSRRALNAVPEFDPNLGPGRLGFEEDRLFGKQLHVSGARFAFVEDAPIVHHCDADRLSRSAHLADAEKLGRSTAYFRYHWNHDFRGTRSHPAWVAAKLIQAIVRLWTRRLTHWGEWQHPEGIMKWELRALMDVYQFRQLFHEVGTKRNYARPHALTRRSTRSGASAPPLSRSSDQVKTTAAGSASLSGSRPGLQ